MSSINHEESGYGLGFNLLTISYQSHASYTKRIGLVGRSNHVNPFTLGMRIMCGHIRNHAPILSGTKQSL